jgi:hypothetical protein
MKQIIEYLLLAFGVLFFAMIFFATLIVPNFIKKRKIELESMCEYLIILILIIIGLLTILWFIVKYYS